MRNLLIVVALVATAGWGVVRDIAASTCGNGNYNVAVCPGILDNLVEDPTTTTPSTCKVEGEVLELPSRKLFKGTFTGCSAREREKELKRLLQ